MSCAIDEHGVPALELVYVVAGDAKQAAKLAGVGDAHTFAVAPGTAKIGHKAPAAHALFVVELTKSKRTACASAGRDSAKTAKQARTTVASRISFDYN